MAEPAFRDLARGLVVTIPVFRERFLTPNLYQLWNTKRFGLYEHILLSFTDAHAKGETYDFENDAPFLAAAFREMGDLISTADYLSGSASVGKVLKRVLDGEALLKDETGVSNDPRNAAFELLVGSWLHRAGIGEPLTNKGDARCRIHDTRFRVECKRIYSEDRRQFLANVRKAADQIDVARNEGLADAGFAVIDMSRIINVEDGFIQLSFAELSQRFHDLHQEAVSMTAEVSRDHLSLAGLFLISRASTMAGEFVQRIDSFVVPGSPSEARFKEVMDRLAGTPLVVRPDPG